MKLIYKVISQIIKFQIINHQPQDILKEDIRIQLFFDASKNTKKILILKQILIRL